MVILGGMANVNFYHVMVRTIPKDNWIIIIIRSSAASIAYIGVYYGLQYLPMVESQLITNMAPLLVAVVAYFFMAERLTTVDIIALIISFAGIIIMCFGNAEASASGSGGDGVGTQATTREINIALIVTVISTFLVVIGTITTRLVRRTHYLAPAFYNALGIFLLDCVGMFFIEDPWQFITGYGVKGWILTIVSGTLMTISQTGRIIAFKYDTASKLSIYQYTSGIYQFIFDLFLGVQFNALQLIGIFTIFAANATSIYFTIQQIRKERLEAQLKAEREDEEADGKTQEN